MPAEFVALGSAANSGRTQLRAGEQEEQVLKTNPKYSQSKFEEKQQQEAMAGQLATQVKAADMNEMSAAVQVRSRSNSRS